MKKAPGPVIALLRGVNVGGNNAVSMPALCELCAKLGWTNVRSYIQSGNLVFVSAQSPAQLETELEAAILRRFKLSIAVVVRTAADLARYLRHNPFPDECAGEPSLVMLALSKRTPHPNAVKLLSERAANGERIARTEEALWLHCPNGMGRSKLTPGFLDRVVGSPVTVRNFRTVTKLKELAA